MITLISKSTFMVMVMLISTTNAPLVTLIYVLSCIFVIVRGSSVIFLTQKILYDKSRYKNTILYIKRNMDVFLVHTALFTFLNCIFVFFELTLPFLSVIIALCGIFELLILQNLSMELKES